MEGIMKRIAADAGTKQAALGAEASDVHDLLVSSAGSSRTPMAVLRQRCLGVLEQALECRGNRLAQDGLDGLLFLLRDNQLHSLAGAGAEAVEEALPAQVLAALSSLPAWTHVPTVQTHCLTLTLQLVSASQGWEVSGDVASGALELAMRTFAAAEDEGVRMASRAAASQIVTSYSELLYREEAEGADLLRVFAELTTLLRFAVERLVGMAGSVDDNPSLLLAVDAVSALLVAQSSLEIAHYEPLASLVWKDLTPALVSLLGLPSMSQAGGVGLAGDGGRGASGVGASALFGAPVLAKSVYTSELQLCTELVRLFGGCEEMRAVLEALFHRLFLFPPPEQRGDILQTFKKCLATPSTVLAIFGAAVEPPEPPVYPTDRPLNTRLWKIVLDSLVECSRCGEARVVVGAMECVEALTGSWAALCLRPEPAPPIPPSVAAALNRRFPSLRHAHQPAFPYPKGHVPPIMLSNLLSGMRLQDETGWAVETEDGRSGEEERSPSPTGASPGAQAKDPHDDVGDALRSVAERIGSALRGVEGSEGAGEAGGAEVFASLRDMLGEERRKAHSHTPASASLHDRRSAADLAAKWREAIPGWAKQKSVIEVDEALQRFASDFCAGQTSEEAEEAGAGTGVLSAEAVYLGTLGALRLANQLNASVPSLQLTEAVFVRELLEGGVEVWAREGWVRAVYAEAGQAGLREALWEATPLRHLVEDLDGGQLLRHVQRLEAARGGSGQPGEALRAARALGRHVLTGSWEGLMAVVSGAGSGLGGWAGAGGVVRSLLRGLSSKRLGSPARLLAQGLASSLRSLQTLASLSNALQLESRSGWIFRQLVEISCPLDELRDLSGQPKRSGLFGRGGSGGWWPLRVPDVLSIDILLSKAIAAGSHSPECWTHALRCCEYVWELERWYTVAGWEGGRRGIGRGLRKRLGKAPAEASPEEGPEELGWEQAAGAGPQLVRSQSEAESVAELMAAEGLAESELLGPDLAKRVLRLLLRKVEAFLQDTSGCLSLASLEAFVEALVTLSESRVLYSTGTGLVEPYGLLERLSATMVRTARGGRPLAHLLRLWPRVGRHLERCASSGEAGVGSRAVAALHECVSAQLAVSEGELAGFRWHHLLLSPLQRILCAEPLELGTADALVCSLAELVESHAPLIRSGWPSVFAALKAVRWVGVGGAENPHSPSADNPDAVIRQRMERTVLDLLGTFLGMEDWEVFSLASLDLIACLMRYLQAREAAPSEEPEGEWSSGEGQGVGREFGAEEEAGEAALHAAALRSVRRLHQLFGSLFALKRTPAAHLLHRLRLREQSVQYVDEQVAGLHLDCLPSLLDHMSQKGFFGRNLADVVEWLEEAGEEGEGEGGGAEERRWPWSGLGRWQRGLLEGWLSLVEGLVGAVPTAPVATQAGLLNVLFEVLESLQRVPGQALGDHCLRHSVLPMLQQWERRVAGDGLAFRENCASVRNLKHAAGLLSQLVLHYVSAQPHASEPLFKDFLSVMLEWVGSGSELVSRLALSCLSHLLLSAAPALSPGAWDSVCRALWKATLINLYHLRVLMELFSEGSKDYYGDLGRVEVALRKDSNPREAKRVRALATQVFLLDSQKGTAAEEDALSRSHRSVVLLLHLPPQHPLRQRLLSHQPHPSDSSDQDPPSLRLPFRHVVIGLLSEQLLLQLLGGLLLSGTEFGVSGVSCQLLRQMLGARGSAVKWGLEKGLPGQLGALSARQLSALLLSVEAAFQVGLEFDRRAGLKFLLQRVFNGPVAANLYAQTSTAWALRSLVLLEMGGRAQAPLQELKELCGDAERASGALIPDGYPGSGSLAVGLRLLAEAFARLSHELLALEASSYQPPPPPEVEAPPLVFLVGPTEGGDGSARLAEAQAALEEALRSAHAAEAARLEAGQDGCEAEEAEDGLTSQPTSPAAQHKYPGEERASRDAHDPSGTDEEESVLQPVTANSVQDILKEYKARKLGATMPPKAPSPEPPTAEEAEEARLDKVSRLSHPPSLPLFPPSRGGPKAPSPEPPTAEEAEEARLDKERWDSRLGDEAGRAAAWTDMALVLLDSAAAAEGRAGEAVVAAVWSSAVRLAEAGREPRLRAALAHLLRSLNQRHHFAH